MRLDYEWGDPDRSQQPRATRSIGPLMSTRQTHTPMAFVRVAAWLCWYGGGGGGGVAGLSDLLYFDPARCLLTTAHKPVV